MSTDVELEIPQPKQNKFIGLFYGIIGWPRIDIEHDKAVRAMKTFMLFGKLLLIYQPNPKSEQPKSQTKWFNYLSITIDLLTIVSIIRLLCCTLTDNRVTLAYLGDEFSGLRNEYELRIFGICQVACLGGFRAITCYLIRNGSLDWIKVIDRAMVKGWNPEVLDMNESSCLKWRQVSVFIARQIVGASIIVNLIWTICFSYLIINCETFYLATQSLSILSFFIFWQLIVLISILWFVPQVAWVGYIYGICLFYAMNKSNSTYSNLQASLESESLSSFSLRKLCYHNISVLNEFDYINRSMRYIGYCGYNFLSAAGQVAMLYSYYGLFGMPLADFGAGIVSYNTVFQIGLISFLATKSVSKIGPSYSHYHRIYQYNYSIEPRLKLKMLYNLERLSSPFVGFWVGESFVMDNYSFITFIFETCCNIMLIIVTISSSISRYSDESS